MTQNLDNALHGVQEARTAIMVETGDAHASEQKTALEDIEWLLKHVEAMIKAYGN